MALASSFAHLSYDVEVMGRKAIKPAFSVFYTLIKDKTWDFNQLECVHGPI